MNIARHMELTKMQAGKEEQEQQATQDFGSPNSILKTFVKYMNQLGMSKYPVSARNYPQWYSCGKEQQGSKLKGFSEQQREFRGIL